MSNILLEEMGPLLLWGESLKMLQRKKFQLALLTFSLHKAMPQSSSFFQSYYCILYSIFKLTQTFLLIAHHTKANAYLHIFVHFPLPPNNTLPSTYMNPMYPGLTYPSRPCPNATREETFHNCSFSLLQTPTILSATHTGQKRVINTLPLYDHLS